MSKADSVFGPLAGPLVAEWGSSCQYIRVSDPGTYDPTTGIVASTETTFNVKAVMLELEPQEYEGVFQQSDFKLIIDPGPDRQRLHHNSRPVRGALPQRKQELQGDRRRHLPRRQPDQL